MLIIRSATPEGTRAVGAALARAVEQRQPSNPLVIALNGELGAGKTTLVSGFLTQLGVSGAIKSPTYTLIEPYELTHRSVYHIDLYRLAGANELEMLAPRDLLEPRAILLVEWAERAGNALPDADLAITLRYENAADLDGQPISRRSIEIDARTKTGERLAASLQGEFDEASISS